MKQEILHNIQAIAKDDFKSIQETINTANKDITASVSDMRFVVKDNIVTASCDFNLNGEVVVASVNYESKVDGIYADASVNDVADEVLGVVKSTKITAADEDDAFDFDSSDFEDAPLEDDPADESLTDDEVENTDEDEMEDPEEDLSIETENNISGHYIAECNRCHGVFISALMESDQRVEFISGICPLCEKESDQYIKWVIKPVEF